MSLFTRNTTTTVRTCELNNSGRTAMVNHLKGHVHMNTINSQDAARICSVASYIVTHNIDASNKQQLAAVYAQFDVPATQDYRTLVQSAIRAYNSNVYA